MSNEKRARVDRTIHVQLGDGAAMTLPTRDWLWQLRYQRPEPARGNLCDDRMLAAGMGESYLYLIEECTKEEAWRRIKLLRTAIRSLKEKA